MVKESFFKWPFGKFLRSVGGIPVKQGKGANLVLQVIKEFQTREVLHLAIAPEEPEVQQRDGKPASIP